MPTNQNAYNSRVTDEALEKRFRDTFRSQGGAELVDDLYASGVIVPVVDFTQAATGEVLNTELQQAWDFSTGLNVVASSSPTTVISNAGFWKIDLTASVAVSASGSLTSKIDIFDGTTAKIIWNYQNNSGSTVLNGLVEDKFVVFLRSGDVLRASTQGASHPLSIWYRQIADLSGNLVNPSGFTSS